MMNSNGRHSSSRMKLCSRGAEDRDRRPRHGRLEEVERLVHTTGESDVGSLSVVCVAEPSVHPRERKRSRRVDRARFSASMAEEAPLCVARCCTFVARRPAPSVEAEGRTDQMAGSTCDCQSERPTRIELASSAWKAEVLPLNYGRESASSLKPLLSTP